MTSIYKKRKQTDSKKFNALALSGLSTTKIEQNKRKVWGQRR